MVRTAFKTDQLTLARYRRVVGPRQFRRLVWVSLLAIVAGALEAVGAVLVLLLLSTLVDPGGALDIPLLGSLDQYTSGMTRTAIQTMLALVVGAFFLVRGAVRLAQAYFEQRVAHTIGTDISTRLFTGYLGLPYTLHMERTSVEFIRNGHEAVQRLVVDVVLPSIRLLADSCLLVGMFVVLAIVAPIITLVAAVVIGLVAVVTMRAVNPRVKLLGSVRHMSYGQALGVLQESFATIREIKIRQKVSFFANRYASRREELARAFYLSGFAGIIPKTALELTVLMLIVAFVLWASVTNTSGGAALALMGTFAYAAIRIQPAMGSLVKELSSIRFGASAFEAVATDLEWIEAHVPPHHRPVEEKLLTVRDIRLRNVGYQYPSAASPALEAITFEMRRGEWIGICGPTGGGKSTLLDVFCGLIRPTEGEMTVNGRVVGDVLPCWWSKLGVVPQTVILLNESLRSNIAFGVLDEEIDDSRVVVSMQRAALGEFLASQPDGLDTKVGERGIRLSGGERQRIAIARALYSDPEVLVLDEGTSALDSETEEEIVATLEGLRGELGVVLVAHRTTTLRTCDSILVVEKGRIVESGTYQDLVAGGARFRQLSGQVPEV